MVLEREPPTVLVWPFVYLGPLLINPRKQHMELVPKKYYNTPLEKWTLLVGIFSLVDQILASTLHVGILLTTLSPLLNREGTRDFVLSILGAWIMLWIPLFVIYGASHSVTKRRTKEVNQ